MDQQKSLVSSELCRLCLKEGGAINLFEKRDLVEDIYLCTGVKVSILCNLCNLFNYLVNGIKCLVETIFSK